MFDSLEDIHERAVQEYFEYTGKTDPVALRKIIEALNSCRRETVESLKVARLPETRRKLRTLYEGIGIIIDLFISASEAQAVAENNISSVLDRSAPAVRDF